MSSSISSSKSAGVGSPELTRWAPLMVTAMVTIGLLLGHNVVRQQFTTPALAENNSQVVVLRTQQYEFGSVPHTVFAGSSITGRLPAAAFTEAGHPVTNLGLNGLSTAFGLDVILDQETLPSVVLVEVNTLFKPVGANAETIDGVRNGFGYEVARAFPATRVESRPSTVLYNEVRRSRDDRFVVAPVEVPIEETRPVGALPPDPRIEVQVVEAAIRALLERDVEVLLVLLPTAGTEEEPLAVGQEVATRMAVPLVDLSGMADDERFYTDGTHLTPVAGDRVARALASYLSSRDVGVP